MMDLLWLPICCCLLLMQLLLTFSGVLFGFVYGMNDPLVVLRFMSRKLATFLLALMVILNLFLLNITEGRS